MFVLNHRRVRTWCPQLIAAALALVSVQSDSGAASTTRAVNRTYVAPTIGPLIACTESGPMIGGACFHVQDSDSRVLVQVYDLAADRPIGGWYRFLHTRWGSETLRPFCGTFESTVDHRAHPFDEVWLYVVFDLNFALATCSETPGLPTTGSVNAVFEQRG